MPPFVIFLSNLSPQIYQPLVFPQNLLLLTKKEKWTLPLNKRYPCSKYKSHCLSLEPGLALCVNDIRLDHTQGPLLTILPSSFLLGEIPGKNSLLISRISYPNFFNNWIFSIAFLWGENKHLFWQSRKLSQDIPNYFFALLLGWQLLGEKTDYCMDHIRRSEFAYFSFITWSRFYRIFYKLNFFPSQNGDECLPWPTSEYFGRSKRRICVKRICHSDTRI